MAEGDSKLTREELGRATVDELTAQPRAPLRAVLVDVRSRHNVGSIFRTADAFRIDGLDLCGFTPQPPHREIEKTALGATTSVPWQVHVDVIPALHRLKQDGWTLLAVEQTRQAIPLEEWTLQPGTRLALVLGNELHGVPEGVLALCDGAISLPQYGMKHSLNVAVCAGIVFWWLAGRSGPHVSHAPGLP